MEYDRLYLSRMSRLHQNCPCFSIIFYEKNTSYFKVICVLFLQIHFYFSFDNSNLVFLLFSLNLLMKAGYQLVWNFQLSCLCLSVLNEFFCFISNFEILDFSILVLIRILFFSKEILKDCCIYFHVQLRDAASQASFEIIVDYP